jgi:hypothetical protein
MGYGLKDRDPIIDRSKRFFFRVQTGSRAYPASYAIGSE